MCQLLFHALFIRGLLLAEKAQRRISVARLAFARGGRYPLLQNARLPRFNWLGLGAYAAGAVVAYLSPWIAPLVGISVSALVYIALTLLSKRQPAAVAEQEP